jgi:hypothetical protein
LVLLARNEEKGLGVGRSKRVEFTRNASRLHTGFTQPGHCSPPLAPIMKSSSALLLQIVTVLLGLAVLVFMLWEPHLEGRNAHATTFEIYFKDPFLAYVYFGSIPFFVALYRAFKLFGHVRQTRAYSQANVDALRGIKKCGFALIGFVLGGAGLIVLFGDGEDRPAGIFMSFLAIVCASIVAVAAALFGRHVQNALRQSERSRA